MAALFNMTTTLGPEIILGSVNTYLDQFDPVNLLLFTLVASTILYTVFPHVNYLVAASLLSLAIGELFRIYKQDFEVMDTTTQTLYVTGSSMIIGLFTFCVSMVLY